MDDLIAHWNVMGWTGWSFRFNIKLSSIDVMTGITNGHHDGHPTTHQRDQREIFNVYLPSMEWILMMMDMEMDILSSHSQIHVFKNEEGDIYNSNHWLESLTPF